MPSVLDTYSANPFCSLGSVGLTMATRPVSISCLWSCQFCVCDQSGMDDLTSFFETMYSTSVKRAFGPSESNKMH